MLVDEIEVNDEMLKSVVEHDEIEVIDEFDEK